MFCFIVQTGSFAAHEWITFSSYENYSGTEGLWEHCEDAQVGTCCQSLDSRFEEHVTPTPGKSTQYFFVSMSLSLCLCMSVSLSLALFVSVSVCRSLQMPLSLATVPIRDFWNTSII